MIKYIKKDITEVKEGLVVHGCNCSGGFGSGVAGAIRKKWPEAYNAFMLYKDPKLGQLVSTKITTEKNLYIGNGYTQESYGYDGRKYASMKAIKDVMLAAIEEAKILDIKNIYIPKIGSKRGGLNWAEEVYPMINELNTKGITINVCII